MSGVNLNITADPYPDDFTVNSEGTRIFKYATSNFAGGVSVEREGYRAIYTPFDFDNVAGTDTRTALIERILSFLTDEDIPWLATTPITGTLTADGTAVIAVEFDAGVAEITQSGDYFAELRIKNSAPYGNMTIPITMSVTTPTHGTVEGTVTGLGYCDNNPVPVEGAEILIESSSGLTWTQVANTNGWYSLKLDPIYAPLTLTVTATGHESGIKASIPLTAGVATEVNFDLRWLQPCSAVAPRSLSAELFTGQEEVRPLSLSNLGAADMNFELSETAPWLTHEPITGSVPLDHTRVVSITFTALPTLTSGIYTTTLVVQTNDPISPSIGIPVTLTTTAPELTVNVSGSGTVDQAPLPPYIFGQNVTLTATAEPGWTFTGWSGDLEGENGVETITMDAAKAVTATFTLLTTDLNLIKVVNPSTELSLGDLVTYTITLRNSGDVSATSILLTDTLPSALSFATFVEDGGAVEDADVVTWNGDLGSGDSLTIAFKATVMDEAAEMITNVVEMVSENAGNGSAQATFTIESRYTIYLPLILR
jgi:uncharacterized repeat protein (TIGR01451 family)/uncharacterized repeat protein (TIGR02543 family)